MKLAFYNVENLFDTLDDPYVNDNAFLPDSGLKWDQKRYILKLRRIAKVIMAIENPMPLIIGFAEIENRKVLADLVTALGFTENEIGIIHENSPDERGIDVGLLYRKDIIVKTEHTSHPVIFPDDLSDKTRDILHVKAHLSNNEALHLFVNHWPSRKAGAKQSQGKRFTAAKKLKYLIDQTLEEENDAKIIAMGDFNCDPEDAPIRRILDKENSDIGPLYNLAWKAHKNGEGSMNYKGKWLMFDQVLVSESLITENKGIRLIPDSFTIFKKDWMLFFNPKYRDSRPNKTYGGRKYHGGFSDHLPVYICVE